MVARMQGAIDDARVMAAGHEAVIVAPSDLDDAVRAGGRSSSTTRASASAAWPP
jgi:hypothetical protein